MTRPGGRQSGRGAGGGKGRGGESGEGAGGFVSSLMGTGGGGDTGAESMGSVAGRPAEESMEIPLGAGRAAAPSTELLAHMLGAGAAETALGPVGAAVASPDDGVDKSRWHVIYPAYLDKKKSLAGGRRVSLGVAVQEPRVEEMKKICDHLRVPAVIEYLGQDENPQRGRGKKDSLEVHGTNATRSTLARSRKCKRYPRDWLFGRGRLRVQFKNTSDHSFYNPDVPNKKVLMRRMCELIPQLKTRSTAGGASGGGTASSSLSGKKKKK